jgi:ABC-type uncharacterized transport system fused permease/ATPase subunit
MSQQSPMLIREPDLRWPIYLVAAIITALIVLVIASLMHLALTRPVVKLSAERRLQGAIRPGMPEFETLSEKIIVEQPEATEAARPLNDTAVEVNATVRNSTDRTLNGLEMRGAVLDRNSSPFVERTVVVVPARQTALDPGEAIKVRILLEGVSPDAERAGLLMEVAGLRFD